MPAQLLDGRVLAAKIKQETKTEITKAGIKPGLAALLIGADPASHLYVGLKEKACAEAGIHFEKYLFFATEPQEKILAKIRELNARTDIHAILIQLPLPAPLDENAIIGAVDPKKDVDGFHPENLGLLRKGTRAIIPGVSLGIVALIELSGRHLEGKRAALLVNSEIFAAPVAHLLGQSGVTVETIIAPSDLETVATRLRAADIVVTAIGRAHAVTGDMLKPGVIVVDVGTNRLPDGTLAGDVEPESANKKAGFLTPVPGGVGPMTVAMLLQNVLRLTQSSPTPPLQGSSS